MQVLTGAVVFETEVAASSQGYVQALEVVDVHASGRRVSAARTPL
jgi:hypothetical protein